MTLKSTVKHANGTSTNRWESASAGIAVAATGVPGTTMHAWTVKSKNGVQIYADVTPPAIDKTSPAFKSAVRRAAVAPNSEPPIYRTTTGDSYGDKVNNAYQAHEHFSDIQRIIQNNGGGDVYVSDEMTGTSTETTTGHDHLYATYGANAYPSTPAGNTLIKWAPSATLHPSACRSDTEGFSYGGASISSTTNICPDTIDPYTDNLGGAGLEEFWHGCDNHGSVGLNPVDVVHSPPDTSIAATVHLYMHLIAGSC